MRHLSLSLFPVHLFLPPSVGVWIYGGTRTQACRGLLREWGILESEDKKRKKADFVQGHGYISDLRRLSYPSMKKTWGVKLHSRLSAATLSISVTSKGNLEKQEKEKEAHQRLLD